MIYSSGNFYYKLSLTVWGAFFFIYLPFFFIFSILLKNKWSHRKILKNHDKNDYFKDFIISVRTFFVYQLIFSLIYFLYLKGHTRLYQNFQNEKTYYLISMFFLLCVFHECYFYFTHKLMHENAIFKKCHALHHSSYIPTPLSANLFSMTEAFLQGLFYLLVAVLIPIPIILLILFFYFINVINAYLHTEYECLPNNLYRIPFFYTINSVTHHNFHHHLSENNYSFLFRILDYKFKTLDSNGHLLFYKTREKINHFFKKNDYIPIEYRSNPEDILGQYFEAGFDYGDDVKIFYELNGEDMSLYHSYIDGVGGLLHNLKLKTITLLSTPKLRVKTYSFWTKLQIFIFSINSLIKKKSKWINKKKILSNQGSLLFKGFFSEEELRIAHQKASFENITLNTLFIHEFNKILKIYVTVPEAFTWAIPVSKRKNLTYNFSPGNEVWFIDVTIKKDDVSSLHKQLSLLYADIDVYGGLSLGILMWPFRLFLFPVIWAQRFMGLERHATFSNLGSFSGKEPMDIFFCPPTHICAPFAIGCVTYNSKCTFTIKVHPALPFKDVNEIADIFLQFKKAVCGITS